LIDYHRKKEEEMMQLVDRFLERLRKENERLISQAK